MTTNQTISDILQQEDLLPKSPFVFHEGGFELQTVDKLIAEVDNQTDVRNFSFRLKKKAFNIGVEVIQNLFHYLEGDHVSQDNNMGLFTMYEEDDSLYMMTGNFLNNSQISNVTSRISMINAISPEELKTLYRGVLDVGSVSESGGAGLGFIDIARKSGSLLDYNFIKVDATNSFFVLKTKINE